MTGSKAFTISKKRVWQTGEYIMQHGRQIDKAFYMHYFENKPAFSVIAVLESYINEDNGVGGLELDMLYEGSTAISCAIFLRLIHELKVTMEFDSTHKVLEYLNSCVGNNGSWHPSTPDAARVPRAEWLDWDDSHYNRFFLHPTSEIAGYFYHFGGGDYRAFAKELLDNLYTEVIQRFAGTLEEKEVISLMQLCRLLPDIAGERFINILKPHLKEMLVLDPKRWSEGGLTPLSVFRSPLDPLYYDFEKEINRNLDYEISNQPESSIWKYHGHWNMFYDEYMQEEKKMVAHHNLNRLIQLKNFGRITRMNK